MEWRGREERRGGLVESTRVSYDGRDGREGHEREQPYHAIRFDLTLTFRLLSDQDSVRFPGPSLLWAFHRPAKISNCSQLPASLRHMGIPSLCCNQKGEDDMSEINKNLHCTHSEGGKPEGVRAVSTHQAM